MILSIKIYRLLKLLFCVFLTTQCSIVYFILIKTLVQGVPFNEFFFQHAGPLDVYGNQLHANVPSKKEEKAAIFLCVFLHFFLKLR